MWILELSLATGVVLVSLWVEILPETDPALELVSELEGAWDVATDPLPESPQALITRLRAMAVNNQKRDFISSFPSAIKT